MSGIQLFNWFHMRERISYNMCKVLYYSFLSCHNYYLSFKKCTQSYTRQLYIIRMNVLHWRTETIWCWCVRVVVDLVCVELMLNFLSIHKLYNSYEIKKITLLFSWIHHNCFYFFFCIFHLWYHHHHHHLILSQFKKILLLQWTFKPTDWLFSLFVLSECYVKTAITIASNIPIDWISSTKTDIILRYVAHYTRFCLCFTLSPL